MNRIILCNSDLTADEKNLLETLQVGEYFIVEPSIGYSNLEKYFEARGFSINYRAVLSNGSQVFSLQDRKKPEDTITRAEPTKPFWQRWLSGEE